METDVKKVRGLLARARKAFSPQLLGAEVAHELAMKTKVLLIDDEKGFTQLLRLNLEETGQFEVRVENWAEDAWGAAKEFRPDIILLDLFMPRMPGGNVAALLEADPQLREIPIVFVTAGVRPEIVKQNEGVICDHPCLAKPVTIDEVRQMIGAQVRRRSVSAALT